LMKPEHKEWIGEILERLNRAHSETPF
jgi:hypothetical protein